MLNFSYLLVPVYTALHIFFVFLLKIDIYTTEGDGPEESSMSVLMAPTDTQRLCSFNFLWILPDQSSNEVKTFWVHRD